MRGWSARRRSSWRDYSGRRRNGKEGFLPSTSPAQYRCRLESSKRGRVCQKRGKREPAGDASSRVPAYQHYPEPGSISFSVIGLQRSIASAKSHESQSSGEQSPRCGSSAYATKADGFTDPQSDAQLYGCTSRSRSGLVFQGVSCNLHVPGAPPSSIHAARGVSAQVPLPRLVQSQF